MDIVKAVNDVTDVSGLPSKYVHFIAVFQSATETAKTLDITVKKPRHVGRSVYRDNAGDSSQSVENYHRLNVFLPLIDSVCTHLEDRFGPIQQKLFGLSALIPAYLGSYTDVVSAASFYRVPRINS